MEFTEDPNECWYKANFDKSCPYKEFCQHSGLVERLNFSMMSIEAWEHTDPNTKLKETKYGFSPERFRLALDLYGVPLRAYDPPSDRVDFNDGLHAFNWTQQVRGAMEDAPKQSMIEARARRRKKRQEQIDQV